MSRFWMVRCLPGLLALTLATASAATRPQHPASHLHRPAPAGNFQPGEHKLCLQRAQRGGLFGFLHRPAQPPRHARRWPVHFRAGRDADERYHAWAQ